MNPYGQKTNNTTNYNNKNLKQNKKYKNTYSKLPQQRPNKKPNQITNLHQIIINKQQVKTYKDQPILLISYTFPTQLLLLLSGDIETNPGPMPNILQTHPATHRNRCKCYFIECTIKLQLEYQHLAKQFSPIINITHPHHQNASAKYPYLYSYIHRNQHHPPPRILYALITTISPLIDTCNHILIQPPVPDWTTNVLERMASLQNPPERHITSTHPYTQFMQTNQNIVNPPNTIHKELYTFIQESNESLTI
jgi:hypothetical protein